MSKIGLFWSFSPFCLYSLYHAHAKQKLVNSRVLLLNNWGNVI